ncbi:MAG TPA: class I SAM-dependent methyltransferase [Polyangia bacterium]|nr:class I SAM-dependent methyltransferase [Polyangia bacterium]
MSDPHAPPPSSPLATPEPWDLVAAAYAAEALPYFEIFAREALAHAALRPGARIVDVAAGPGTLSLLAAAAGARVSALDFSPRMVAELESRRAAAGLADAIEVRAGDGQQLPFESGAYDAAFSMFGLMFFPDRAAGFREMRRVLRPGGHAIVSSWVPFDGPFGAIMKMAAELVPGRPLGGGGAEQPLASPTDFEAEMSAAGFGSIRVVTVPHELKLPSFDAFWTAMQRTNAPLVLARHRVGAERWAVVGPQLRERLRATLGDGPLVAGRGAYLGIGVA